MAALRFHLLSVPGTVLKLLSSDCNKFLSRDKTGFELMLNYMSGEDFLGVRTSVKIGGGWLSSGRAFPTPSPGM